MLLRTNEGTGGGCEPRQGAGTPATVGDREATDPADTVVPRCGETTHAGQELSSSRSCASVGEVGVRAAAPDGAAAPASCTANHGSCRRPRRTCEAEAGAARRSPARGGPVVATAVSRTPAKGAGAWVNETSAGKAPTSNRQGLSNQAGAGGTSTGTRRGEEQSAATARRVYEAHYVPIYN